MANSSAVPAKTHEAPGGEDLLLNFAVGVAHDAGRLLAERFGRPIEVVHKGDINLVTDADLAAERLIIDRIRSHYPRHAILAEESGDSQIAAQQPSELKWIIDPLDGTVNYAHGYPCFCVSIALERRGVIEIGVIYDPIREETFAAEKGQGATLNSKSIRVSNTDDLNRSLVCTGFPYDVRERGDFARHFRNFIMHAQSVRRDGSAALDLAAVACGRFEGFWEEGLRPWDVAAGILLIEEAGGRVSDYQGGKFDTYTAPIVATNGLIHDQMMRVLAL